MIKRSMTVAAAALFALSLAACVSMSRRDEHTAVGAAVGGVAGAVLTNGSPLGTVGGAVVGGVIGNQIETEDRREPDHRRHGR